MKNIFSWIACFVIASPAFAIDNERIVDSHEDDPATESSPENLESTEMTQGRLNMDRYCRNIGQYGATNINGTAYGWRCHPSYTAIDFNAACRQQYGYGYAAAISDDTWVCLYAGTGGYPRPQPPTQYYRVNFNRYCMNHGYNRAANPSGTLHGWRCMPGRVQVNVHQACREQYGYYFRAATIGYGPNDWVCTR